MGPQAGGKVHAFFGRVVDDEHTVHTGFGRIAHKAVDAVFQVVVLHRIGVAHQHDGGACVGGAELTHHGQHLAHAHTVAQRGFTGFLDHRAVGHGVAEGHAQFNDVSATFDQCVHQA